MVVETTITKEENTMMRVAIGNEGVDQRAEKGRDALERLTGVDEETAVAEATIVRARKATTIYTNAKIVNGTWRANFRYQEDW